MPTKSEKIELWFDEKKNKLFEQYKKSLEANKPDAEKIYKEKMTKLRQEFEKRSYGALEDEKTSLNKPKEKNKISLKIEEIWNKILGLFNEK